MKSYLDTGDYDSLEDLIGSRSPEEADESLEDLRKVRENLETASANGITVEAIGTLLGLAPDIAALVATGGSSTPVLGGRLVLTGTGLAQRVAAGGRLATLGAAEGAAERSAQGLTDPTISRDDVLMASGIGAAAGLGIGLVSPAMFGNVFIKAARVEDDVAEAAGRAVDDLVGPQGDLSAARVLSDDDTAVPAKGSGSLLAKHLPRKAAAWALRNPKRIIVDLGVKGRKDAERGLTGTSRAFDILSRFTRLSTLMESDLRGVARRDTVEDFLNSMHLLKQTREVEARQQYVETLQRLWPDGAALARRSTRFGVNAGPASILTQPQLEQLASKYSAANALDALDEFRLPDDLSSQLTPIQRNILTEQVAKVADAEDAYYRRFGELEVENGLLTQDDLIDGYRPQIWQRDVIALRKPEFRAKLIEHFRRSPDDAWARERGLLSEGEDFLAVSRTDPERAEEIIDEWGREIRGELQEELERSAANLRTELAAHQAQTVQEIDTRLTDSIAKDRGVVERALRAARDTSQNPAKRNAAATRAASAQRRLDDNQASLRRLRAVQEADDGLRQIIDDIGTRAERTALREVTERASRAEAKAEAERLRPTLSQEIDDIINRMTDGRDPFGMIEAEFASTSNRTKRRSLFLGRAFVRGDFDEFLEGDAGQLRTGHMYSVGPQVALRQTFGNDFNPKQLLQQVREAFDDDLAKVGNTADRAAILRDRDFAETALTKLIERTTTHGAGGQFGQRFSSVMSRVTSLTMLGAVTLAQLGDTALAAFAGGRFRPVQRFWRATQVRSALKEVVEGGRPELAAAIAGLDSISMATFRARAGLDPADLMIPGGALYRRAATGLDKVSVIQGWLNFMHVWNLGVRGGFGLDFMRQIDVDLAGYTKLNARMKAFYARIGIDETMARRITDELRSKNIKVSGVTVPDTDTWDDTLLSRYMQAVKVAGDEALLEPGLFDTPFLSHYPMGRLVLQFQQFMFTAGERFIAPMIQEFRMSPTSIRPYAAALMGLQLGMMTDVMRAAMFGNLDEWEERWETPGGAAQNMTRGLLRSPLLAGPSGLFIEQGMQLAGLDTGRFFNTVPLAPLAGPSFNLVAGEGGRLIQNVAEGVKGDSEAFQKVIDKGRTRLPFVNIWQLRMLDQLISED